MTEFCAQYSRDVGEPLAGTATHAQSNLLLSWPIGHWTRTYHQAKTMTPEVAQAVRDLVNSGRRINLIHRADQPRNVHRAYRMPECEAYDIPTDELHDFLTALHLGRALDAWFVGPAEQRIVLCCTHGVKDKCCAKFGNASFKALDEAAQSYPGEFEIWQSTHLGGCRLASAALVFPALRKYGRIEPEQATALLDTERRDQPYLPCYRGDAALSPAQQIADIEARNQLQRVGIEPCRVSIVAEQSHDNGDQHFEMRWQTSDSSGNLNIELNPITTVRYATCADIDAGEPPVEHPTWQPQVVDPVR